MIRVLKVTQNDLPTFQVHESLNLYWYVNSAFYRHIQYKSHMVSVFTLGNSFITSVNFKQKRNTWSMTDSELVAVDDTLSKIICTNTFMQLKLISIKLNVVYHHNQSFMNLENNGKQIYILMSPISL